MSATIKYTLQRAVLFLAPFAILMIAQVPWYISLVVALVFAFCASYVFLRRSRDAALAEIEQRVPRRHASDEDVEDAARDDAETVDAETADADETGADAAETDDADDEPAGADETDADETKTDPADAEPASAAEDATPADAAPSDAADPDEPQQRV